MASDVRRLLIDMETGQRGFIITGEPSFLEPWEIGRRTLPERVATLRKIVDDPGQAKRAEQLETDSLAYIREYSVPLVDAARRGRRVRSEGSRPARMGNVEWTRCGASWTLMSQLSSR